MILLVGVGGLLAGAGGVLILLVFLRRQSARRVASQFVRPVNYVGGLVLPVPDDCRWRGSDQRMQFGGGGHLLIEVVLDSFSPPRHFLRIGGKVVPYSLPADEYCRAVVRSARSRRLESLSRRVDDAVQDS